MRRRASSSCPRDLLTIYQCFSDETRLRILHVLLRGPLYVWQIERVLSLKQHLISRHLAYLRWRGMVHANKEGNRVAYSLPIVITPEVQANLDCLERFALEAKVYRLDLEELERMWGEAGG